MDLSFLGSHKHLYTDASKELHMVQKIHFQKHARMQAGSADIGAYNKQSYNHELAKRGKEMEVIENADKVRGQDFNKLTVNAFLLWFTEFVLHYNACKP